MSEAPINPEQLILSFEDDVRISSAKVFSLADHRQRVQVSALSDATEEISKEQERQILDEVIKQAEQLPWYK